MQPDIYASLWPLSISNGARDNGRALTEDRTQSCPYYWMTGLSVNRDTDRGFSDAILEPTVDPDSGNQNYRSQDNIKIRVEL